MPRRHTLRFALALALMLGLSVPAWAQPVFDAVSGSSTASGSSLTFSHTLGSGSDRALYCWAGTMGNGVVIDSVTYDGDAMTELVETAGSPTFAHLALYRIVEAGGLATGAANVVVTPASTTEVFALCMSFTTVDQTTPNDTPGEANSDAGDADQTIASATGDLVAQGGLCQVGGGASSATTSHTERRDSLEQGYMLNLAQTATGAASVVLDWTLNTGLCENWRAFAVNINVAAATSTCTGGMMLLGAGKC